MGQLNVGDELKIAYFDPMMMMMVLLKMAIHVRRCEKREWCALSWPEGLRNSKIHKPGQLRKNSNHGE
jgi:hypothetical protein